MENYAEAMSVIADYAIARAWTPIGFRTWSVGPWTITVNGTREPVDGLPPFHAKVTHETLVAMMVVHPFGGIIGGGSRDFEDRFIADMRAAKAQP